MVLTGYLMTFIVWVNMPLTLALDAPGGDIFLFLSVFGLMSSCVSKDLKGFEKISRFPASTAR